MLKRITIDSRSKLYSGSGQLASGNSNRWSAEVRKLICDQLQGRNLSGDIEQTLRSPLIDNNSQEHGEGGIHREINKTNTSTIHQKGIDDERKKKVVVEEVKKQLWLAGPLICVSLLQFCLQLISVMFVGHLGELALSGASMATSFASVTGFSMLVS
ncbi:hypothetical protein RHSIM_Rhsim12G0140500 [Rhododendron simsii]|uniref:MATE efflux family protein n=1 Tax=Rhododendron simsii TaxID=118357 RepID=A0A834G5I5_RHOSS|nr:hypothetical protein RHSIM_Rhsim12G0140500 [Rhododendron simsii]